MVTDIDRLKTEPNDIQMSEISDTIENMTQGERDKWVFEELAMIDNLGFRLIGFNCTEGRIILLFENFQIREISIDTFEEVKQIDLFKVNKKRNPGQQAVAFAIEKEMNFIAVASQNSVYVFDFSENYRLITTIEVDNVYQIEFCQFLIVVLVRLEESSFVVSYEIDLDSVEKGSYEIKTNGYQDMISSDNQSIYFACGV